MVSKDKNKVLKYSIKKFSVGTFSVMVGAFIFLATPALASETNSENIHKENSTIIEKEKTKETYKNEVNIANETNNVEKNVSNNAKENYSVEKKSNLIEEKKSEDTTVLESGEKVYSTEKNGESIEEKSSVEKTVAEKPKSRGKRSIDSERESAKRFATNEDFEKISKGLITTEDGKIDNLLFGKTPLKANEDSDGDDAQNGSEIYIYEKDGKTYYGYYGHPFLKDTDGDGITDHDQSNLNKPGDDDNFKWYVTDRDMAMFMKLAYRDDEYIKKVLDKDYKWTAADNNVKDDEKAKNVYELMHNELAGYWEIDKTYHNPSGLDAVLFKTKSALPILPDGLVHVLAIRGTKGSADVGNDSVIALGQDPQQGKEIEKIIEDISKREDIKNFYITGHSLGGYLTQRAVVKLNRLANEENGYSIEPVAKKYRNFYNNVFKKATTFNAPKINASILSGDLYKKSILSKQLAKQGKIKHYGMRGDKFIGLLYNDSDVMTYIEGGEHSSNAYFSAMLNDDDNFNIGERTGVSGKGKQNPVLKNLKIAEPTDEEVRKIVNENIKISLKDQNPVEILALNKISREEVLKKLNLENLPNTATLNINIPSEVQPTAVNYVLPVTISYLGKTVNPNISVVVKVLPNFEELKAIKQKASEEKEKKVDTDHKTAETKNRYDAKKVELDTKLQKVEELLKNSTAKQSDITALTKELETLLEEYKTSVSGLKLDKTLLTDEIARVTNSLETFENTNTALKPVEVVTEFNGRKDELLNNYNNLLKEVKGNLDGIETYDKLVEEKNKFANLEKEISEASSILNKTQKDYYEPIKKSYELYEGDKPNAELTIEKNNAPIKNIIWEIEPSTSSSGNKEGRVKVVYNDDSFDLVSVSVNVKELYGETLTTTEEEKLPLKVIYTGDDTKDYGYISEIPGKDGKVVTTIKSRLNKKTNTVEEISRTPVRTDAVNTVITKGIKTKIKETTIPREVVYEEDASVEKGKDVVKREGEDGKNITTTTYILNSKTGEITEKVTVEKKEKIDKIIARGTKEVASEPEIIEVPADPKINPNEDSTTTEPSTPTNPAEEKPKKEPPADSEQPIQPAQPAQPEKPEKQEQPAQPGESADQGNSTKPVKEKPKDEKPSVPEKQEKPVQPGTTVSPTEEKQKEDTPKVSEKEEQLGQPGTTEQPEETGDQGDSTKPVREKPEKQEKPVQPEAVGEQGDSTQPSTPTNSVEEKPKEDKPSVPEKQEKPVQPGTTVSPTEEKQKEDTPKVLEKEEQLVQPGTTEQPEVSGQPSTPVQPGETGEQGASTKPAEEKPKQPVQPEKQTEPVQPGTTPIPAEEKPKDEKPSVPGKEEQPAQPEKQTEPVQPGTTPTPAEEKPKEETSTDSEKQEQPVQPEKPEKQEQPAQPGETGNQGDSTKPVEEKPKEETPADSEKPEQPVQPEKPEKQEQPAQPEKQTEPVQPGTTSTPTEEKQKEDTPKVSEKEEQPVESGTPSQPEVSGKQGDSTQPSMPVKPEAKEEQGDSAQPSTSTNPVEEKTKEDKPSVPEKQEKPVQPEAVGEQGDSTQPSTPTNSVEEKPKEDKPSVPEKQEKPVQPGTTVSPTEEKQKEDTPKVSEKEEQPVEPGTSTQPEASGKQGDSTQPSTPVKPEEKEEQGDSAQPSMPTNPAEEKPKEDTPKVSEKEEQLVQPGTTEQPEVSGQPSTPVQPGETGEQGASTKPTEEKPKQPVQPKKQTEPVQPGTKPTPAEEKPKEDKPSVPEKQEKPVQPEVSGKQGDSTQPSTPVKPEEKEGQGDSAQPSTPTNPVEEKSKKETANKSDENNNLTNKLKTLLLTALDNRVSLELYDTTIEDIEFRAVEIDDEKAINTVKDKLQGNKNVRIYDLSLHKGGKEISLNNNRLVRVALAEYENKNVEIYHIESDGHLTKIPSIVNNGNVEFYINHFSQFAIVSDKNNLSKKDISQRNKDLFSEVKTDTQNAISKENSSQQQSLPKTGINSTNDFSLLAIISLLVLVLSRKQKNSIN